MKNIYVLILLFSFPVRVAFAQQMAPSIQWQKCLGGYDEELKGKIVKSRDGGYLVAGITSSNDGDVVSHTGNSSIWVVKFTNTGLIAWQKTFGTQIDLGVLDLKNTPDGGYIIATSTAANDAAFSGYHARSDALIIKLSSDGIAEWQKCYGGSFMDGASTICCTNDGGYIFAGQTNSIDGDVTGNNGNTDIWVVKISKLGSLEWQKCLGGTNFESLYGQSYSSGGSIIQTSDNGYTLIGSTNSSNGDVTGYHEGYGFNDVWVVKLDSTGTKVWQKCLGGTLEEQGNDIIQLPDGNYLAIASESSVDGDVSGSHNNSGDIWVVKLSDTGNIIWQKCLGGTANENATTIKTDPEGNFIIGGAASSFDGDVTGLRFNRFHVGTDAWLVKINSTGNILWQKTLGGTDPESIQDFTFTDDGEIIFIGHTQSGNDGDVTGSHNPMGGSTDLWVVKTGAFNIIKGSVYVDYNGNGIKDGNDSWVKSGLIRTDKPNYSWQTTINNGSFLNKVDTGSFVTSLVLDKPYYSIVPATKQSVFSAFLNTDSVSFSLIPIADKRDYRVSLFATEPVRPGFNTIYKIKFENVGTDTLINKTVQLIKDGRTSFRFSSPSATAVSGDTIKWNVSNLSPGDSGFITVNFLTLASTVHIGDTVSVSASIDTTGDLVTSDNVALFRQIVTGSYDPNDKQENYGGFISEREISNNKNLTYTVRFQNTGNDTAFNIIIRDTLDARTDWKSIMMVSASHPYQLSIKDGKYCTWQFSNIKLVDIIHNEPLSHGYFTYSIKPQSTISIGDTIHNSASIYFDYNLPIKTNTQITIVKQNPPPLPVVTGVQLIYCNKNNIQKGKISNLPATGTDVIVSVQIDTIVLQVAPDSTFSFDPGALTLGSHQLKISYSSGGGTSTATYDFTILAALRPDVNISANTRTVINFTDPVVITAINVRGGGSSPKYIFAKDKAFTNVLQAESSNNVLILQPNTLTAGTNKIYVLMKTSDTCFIHQTDLDSINIERSAATGIIDTDFPGQQISAYPNPFRNAFTISGFNTGKTYTLVLTGSAGQRVFSRQINNSQYAVVDKPGLSNGQYLLSIYDSRKRKLIGTLLLLKQ